MGHVLLDSLGRTIDWILEITKFNGATMTKQVVLLLFGTGQSSEAQLYLWDNHSLRDKPSHHASYPTVLCKQTPLIRESSGVFSAERTPVIHLGEGTEVFAITIDFYDNMSGFDESQIISEIPPTLGNEIQSAAQRRVLLYVLSL